MSHLSKIASLTLLVLLALGVANAQVATGTIIGLVQDSAGAAVPNADVTLTQVATGATRQMHASDQGKFNAEFMALGTYAIKVSATGFQTKTLTGLTLQIDQTIDLTVVLTVGSVSQSIEVTSAVPLVDTTTSALGQVIDNRQILSMPLNGRNPFALGLLVGNTAPVTGVATNLPFVGGGGQFSTNDVLLNGIDDNVFAVAGNIGRQGIAIIPSVDAVDEFKVMTNNFPAEFGHAAGYIVTSTVPSLNSCATTISTPTTISVIVLDCPEPHFTRTSLVESLADRSGTTEFSSSAITREPGSPSSLAAPFRVYPLWPCVAVTFQARLHPSSTRGHGTLDRVEPWLPRSS
jgi:hypothetical protein